jgi:tetratricopeptide (TPR) repeat protein
VNLNYNLALLYFSDYAKDSLALSHVERALQANPFNVENLLLKANILMELGDTKESKDILNTVLRLADGDNKAEAYNLLGIMCFREADYSCAVEKFTSAIIITPTVPEYYVRRSSAFGLLKDYDKALKDCNTAISIDSSYIDAYVSRIIIYDRTNNFTKLCSDLKIINRIAPTNTIANSFKNLDCDK